MAVAVINKSRPPTCPTAKVDETNDITTSLPTLQFESAIGDEFKHYVYMRARSHAITASICGQITYFCTVLNEIRDKRTDLNQFKKNKASRLLMDQEHRDPLLIGVIGGGRMGSHIVNNLLTFGQCRPSDITISTRRPETLGHFEKKGMRCINDNAKLAASVHLIILCVLPSQLNGVVEEIKEYITKRTVIYSIIPSVPIARLRLLSMSQFVIKPEYSWDISNASKDWDYTKDFNGIFGDLNMTEKTCPINLRRDDSVIETDPKLAEVFVYGAVNMCTQLHLSREDTLRLVNRIILNVPEDDDLRFEATNFTRVKGKVTEPFPKFDLSVIAENPTPLSKKMAQEEVQKAFVKKYCSAFELWLKKSKFES